MSIAFNHFCFLFVLIICPKHAHKLLNLETFIDFVLYRLWSSSLTIPHISNWLKNKSTWQWKVNEIPYSLVSIIPYMWDCNLFPKMSFPLKHYWWTWPVTSLFLHLFIHSHNKSLFTAYYIAGIMHWEWSVDRPIVSLMDVIFVMSWQPFCFYP